MDNLAERLTHGGRKRILVVDDNEMLLKFWDRLLGTKHLNYAHYTIRKSAEDALKLMDKTKFDIAIIDIVMPNIDGFDFVRKAWSHNPAMQLVFTTAYECDFRHVALNALKESQRDVHVLLKPYQDIAKIEEFIARLSDDDRSLNNTPPIENETNLRFHLWRL